ncbi:ABC transporter ATP-binding protein [Croceibacterium mercuriale]|uniref:ABC transporter ATP-binding protein n=1 Tax=Croceibacterium mercuriale TaxID=1572751 RepID=A0A0B2BYR9_9SPHN|nr:ATP-binding cassette domain-containing protein [Croceibacterium mercuriale]KHL24995.1 ABC transporter ATP-binding protein [Croceibacterium mercuriale]
MLRFDGTSRHFGAVAAVDGVTLDIGRGSFVALVGASGSGKSTLLRTVNRLAEPTGGRVMLDGLDVASLPLVALRRRVGFVFQAIGLFPHLTVAENIAIGPRIQGAPVAQGRVAELLALVQLPADLASRMPAQLSGGQQQRVGIARALATSPPLMLLDEPFGALDPITRDALGRQVRSLHDELDLTTVLVTHDMAEALLLCDRVVVLDRGRVVADETPSALLAGAGGAQAQALVAVPREQARRLAGGGA